MTLIHNLQEMHRHENSCYPTSSGWAGHYDCVGSCLLLANIMLWKNPGCAKDKPRSPILSPRPAQKPTSTKTHQRNQRGKYCAMHCSAIGKYQRVSDSQVACVEKKKKSLPKKLRNSHYRLRHTTKLLQWQPVSQSPTCAWSHPVAGMRLPGLA